MAAVMLATYPDRFAGGAVIGGLPYGCASNIPEALAQMRERSDEGARLLAVVRSAARDHDGLWPSLSLWHGADDRTVDVSNMERLGRQWRHLHGIDDAAPVVTRDARAEHLVWQGSDGRVLVEEHRIAGMGHGVPLDASGADRLGVVGPYMLDVGISSTAQIARSWGILVQGESVVDVTTPDAASRVVKFAPSEQVHRAPPAPAPGSIQQTIESALRSAGLMR
jgi:poly(3-hydroxybutyrate) depolymerase